MIVAAFMAVLYHLGVMQYIVRGMTWAITKVMRVSGAETTSVCASVFIGQTEAPLTVRPYIGRMTNSELLTMMIGGMAHIAGGVMAVYIGMLAGTDVIQQQIYAKHFLAASIMAAPATLLIAKILIPETGTPLTGGKVTIHVERESKNIIDAAAGGARRGFRTLLAGPEHPDYRPFCPAPGHGLGYNDLKVIEARNLLRAVAGGAPAWPDFHEGARVQAVMEAIEASHASGAWTDVGA